MKLSVIVPAFNLAPYIAECLLSLLQQKVNFDFEVIVCDDCSPDETVAEIERVATHYPDLLKPIFKRQNAGLAENMASLLASAQGEYIAYLDGDDLALPGKLQTQVDYLDAHPETAMVYHESDMFDSDSGQSIRAYSNSNYNWQYIPVSSDVTHMVRYGTYMQASSVMFRRHPNLQDAVPRDCRIILDYPFYIAHAALLKGTIDYLPQVLGRYRIHPNSFGAQTSRSLVRREQSYQDMVQACKLAGKLGVEKNIVQQGVYHQAYATALYFLKREAFSLFDKYIHLAGNGNWLFDDKHKSVWQQRAQPEQLRQMLFEAA